MGKEPKLPKLTPIKSIKPNPDNPRIIKDAQFKKLVKSLKDFPVMTELREVVLDEDNIIIGGNMRYRAALDAGWEEIPAKVFTRQDAERNNELTGQNKTYEEYRGEFIIKDNVSGGEWDHDILANGWDKQELEEWGLELDWQTEELEIEEDEAPEVDESEPPKSKLGEVYQLGRHKIMCGDSTKREDVEKLMNGEKADMVFTDPPYGMGKEADGVLNDNLYAEKLLAFNQEWIPLSLAFTKENGSWYCWGIDEPLMDIYAFILKPMIKNSELTFRNLITWNKGNGQGQMAEEFRSYAVADEKCLFVMRGVQGFNNNGDNYYEAWEPIRSYLDDERKKLGWSDKKVADFFGFHPRMPNHWFAKSQWSMPTQEQYERLQTEAQGDAFKRDYDEIKRDYDEIKREWMATRAYFDNTHDNMNNVWHFDRTSESERDGNGGHATPKPLALCARAIKSSSRENESVLDLFGGSGSTLIACEQTNRICYGMEIDPKYVDVIRKRWAKFVYPDRWEKEWEILTPAIEE